jgi:hypothetical protein
MQLQLYIPAVSFVLYISILATQKQPKPKNNAMCATDRYAPCYIFTTARNSIAKPNYNGGNDNCPKPSDYHERRIIYRGADKSLARTTSRCILFDGENISFDASLVIHINSTNTPIMIINRIYETQNLL